MIGVAVTGVSLLLLTGLILAALIMLLALISGAMED
jgi:hypothetical protein